MLLKAARLVCYVILGSGLTLIFLAGPLPFHLFLRYDYELLDLFKTLGIMVELRGLLTVLLTVSLALTGFCLWFPMWRLLKPAKRLAKGNAISEFEIRVQRLYFFWAIFLAGLSMLGDVLTLGILSVILLVAFLFRDYPPTSAEEILPVLFLLVGTGLLLGHIGIVFLIGRSHWRLLRDSR